MSQTCEHPCSVSCWSFACCQNTDSTGALKAEDVSSRSSQCCKLLPWISPEPVVGSWFVCPSCLGLYTVHSTKYYLSNFYAIQKQNMEELGPSHLWHLTSLVTYWDGKKKTHFPWIIKTDFSLIFILAEYSGCHKIFYLRCLYCSLIQNYSKFFSGLCQKSSFETLKNTTVEAARRKVNGFSS